MQAHRHAIVEAATNIYISMRHCSQAEWLFTNFERRHVFCRDLSEHLSRKQLRRRRWQMNLFLNSIKSSFQHFGAEAIECQNGERSQQDRSQQHWEYNSEVVFCATMPFGKTIWFHRIASLKCRCRWMARTHRNIHANHLGVEHASRNAPSSVWRGIIDESHFMRISWAC